MDDVGVETGLRAWTVPPSARVGGEEANTVMGLLSKRVDRDDIKAGDHIYAYRTVYTYSHHGKLNSLFLLHVTQIGECGLLFWVLFVSFSDLVLIHVIPL